MKKRGKRMPFAGPEGKSGVNDGQLLADQKTWVERWKAVCK
jgi:hypothetical protein